MTRGLRRSNADALFLWLVAFYDYNGGRPLTRAQVEQSEHGDIAAEVIDRYFRGLLKRQGWDRRRITDKLDHPYVLTLADYKGVPAIVLDFTDGSGRLTGLRHTRP